MELGILKEVNVRDVWPHEQYSFSKWLASDENINKLGDLLNLSLIEVETEKFIGKYRCDIICKDELSGKRVLIENQLEATNHEHLGKIVTYASGLDADVVVWIVTSATSEHASAIEWLNNHTDDTLAFFLIEVHVLQIGNSLPAPMFKIIEQPNDFVKQTKSMVKNSTLNNSQKFRLEFWNQFNDAIDSLGKPFNKRKPTTDHWYNVAIGSSQCHLSIVLVNNEHIIRICLYINDNKELFDELYSHKDEIENKLGINLVWDRIDGKKASQIYTIIKNLNFKKQDNYPQLMEECINKIIAFRECFKSYI